MHGDRRSTMGHSEVVGDDDIAFKPVMHVKSPCARKMIVQLVPQRHERVVRIADDATSKADIEVQRRVAGGGMADDERVLYAGGKRFECAKARIHRADLHRFLRSWQPWDAGNVPHRRFPAFVHSDQPAAAPSTGFVHSLPFMNGSYWV